jgi:hypothetical protein
MPLLGPDKKEVLAVKALAFFAAQFSGSWTNGRLFPKRSA